jgi:hypothetical protein
LPVAAAAAVERYSQPVTPAHDEPVAEVDDRVDYFDVFELVKPYVQIGASVAELVKFEYRFAALVWLHHTVAAAIDTEVGELLAVRGSGAHRFPGYETESDDVLDESIGLLQQDAAPISAGTIVAACCSALESLLTDLLPAPQNVSLRGLMRKA